jgi:hypothetical protein
MPKIRSFVLASVVAASSVGCGGGGGDSSSASVGGANPPPANPPPPAALGSATLSWTAPMANTDGSPLNDLSGFEIRYGQNPNALDSTQTINGVGNLTYVISNLTSGTWYFSVAARNSAGVASNPSVPVSKVIG